MDDTDRKWMLRLMADRANEAATEMRWSQHEAGVRWANHAASQMHRARADRMHRAYRRRMTALLRIAMWGQK
jgi:hypothetical protein